MRWIVPLISESLFGKGRGLFLMGAVVLRDEHITLDRQPCLGFRVRNSVGNAELSQQVEDARRNFAAFRAPAAAASLKTWRGC